MMEVIPMDMNNNVISKADLWADRIHAFQESGLSRKDWCQQNEIPPSTLGYWIRKIQSESPGTEPASDSVFAKLPSEQELQFDIVNIPLHFFFTKSFKLLVLMYHSIVFV